MEMLALLQHVKDILTEGMNKKRYAQSGENEKHNYVTISSANWQFSFI